MDDKTLNSLVDAVTKNILSISKAQNPSYAKGFITLDCAKKLAKKVEEEAARIGVKAVVAITNAAARPVLIECMDDSYIASYDIALNKAYTSVSLKMPTSTLKTLTKPGDELYGIQFTNQGQVVIFGGGVPLTHNSTIIGALGVSGGSEKDDTYLAEYGAKVFEEELS